MPLTGKPGKSDEKTNTDFTSFIRKLPIRCGASAWTPMPVYGILPDVADDRWLEIFLARGKSEHQKAACLVKTRVLGCKSRVTESVTENKPPSTISCQWSVVS
jgi:hypothetical protein